MKTLLIMVGKTTGQLYTDAIADYAARITHYMPFEVVMIPELKATRNLSEAQQKEREGEAIGKVLQPADTVVLLDERGKEPRSVELAEWLSKWRQNSKHLVFVIGGPYGFSPDIYRLAQEKISLSLMTFSHQMIRLLFVEQLYRAMTILRGEPYHHE